MKLAVYSSSDGSGPLILVAECLRPSIDAEHLYGPLALKGWIDTDEFDEGIRDVLLAAMDDAPYAAVDRTLAHELELDSGLHVDAPPTDDPL